MAELSIPELIRNAAQARGIDPDVALRIAERESSLDPTAKNKRSSAYGLFQVTDDTWKQYKGDPAKRRDLQENLRVGLDVISSNRDTFIKQFGREPNAGELYTMHFLGRTGGPRLLSADPTSPVSSVVSPRVLKANPDIRNKTVGEFIASMQQKMGSKVDTMMAKRGATEQKAGTVPTPQAPKETIKERPVRERIVPLAQGQISQDMIASLGPNYQAALGAISLADTRDEDDDDEMSFAERYAARREEENRFIEEQQQASRPTALASLDLSYQSPFEEEQPQEPVMLAGGGMAEASPFEGLEPTFGQRMGAAVSDAVVGTAVNVYDKLANREGMSAAHKIYLDSFARDKKEPITAKDFNAAELAELQNLILQKEAATGGKGKGAIQYKDYDTLPGGDQRRATGPSLIGGRMPPRPSLSKSLGQFGYERDPKSGEYRVIDEYDFNPQQVVVDGKKVNVPVEHYGDYMSNTLSPFELARLYAGRKMPPGTGRKVDLSVPSKAPVKRAEGSPVYGEMADTGPITADTRRALSLPQGLSSAELLKLFKNVGKEGVSNLESIARGSVAAVPGVVGDIESIFRSDKERKFATTPEVERQYLPSRLTKPTKESAGFIEAGTFIDPTVGLKVAKPVAQGTAKAALAGFKSVSPQLENIIEKSGFGLDKSYIVKPEGGNWAPSLKSGGVETDSVNKFTDKFLEERGIELTDLSAADRDLRFSERRIKELQERIKGREDYIISRTGKGDDDLLEYEKGMLVQDRQYLDGYMQNYNIEVSEVAQSKALNAFIQNKLNPYFRNKFGTASDPIRLQVDKFQLEEKPKLIAEKQRQIDKIKADIDQKAGEAGVDPLVLTNSQERLRKLERELESIRSRTGAFFQPDPTAETAASILRSSTKIDNKRSRAFGKEGALKDFIKGKSDEAISWENRSDELIGVKDPIKAYDDFVHLYPDERPPSWLSKALEKNEPIYYFPNSAGFWRATNGFQHMIDEVSNALNPQSGLPSELRVTGEKLQKMSVEDISRLVDKINGWRASFQGQIDPARANNAAVFKAKDYSVIPNTDTPNTKGFHWVEIKAPTGMAKEKARDALNDALLYEGEMMKHCVGSYCPSVEEGTRIFSLRDAEGRPYTTIELNPDIPDAIETIEEFTQKRGMNTWGASDNEILEEVQRLGFAVPYRIDQIKGIKNTQPVEEAFPFVKDFINNPVMNMNWTGMSNDAILFSNY